MKISLNHYCTTFSCFLIYQQISNVNISQIFGQAGLVAYLLSVCIFVPLYLLPLDLMRKIGLITRRKREHLALRGSTFICSLLLRMIPFAKISITPPEDGSTNSKEEPEPSIWVCNHISMLDCFLLVAGDKRMRGPKRRPIKIVYVSPIIYLRITVRPFPILFCLTHL